MIVTDIVRWCDPDDHLMVNVTGLPLLYCASVSIQTQTLRFMRCGEGRVGPEKHKEWPKDLSPWGLSIYGSIQKIERRMPTAKYRARMILETYERYGVVLDEKWAIVIRNGMVRLANGKAEIKEDSYGISLRGAKGFCPYTEPELAFDGHHHVLIPMTGVMRMLQAQLGRLIDPLAWQVQSNFGQKTEQVLVVNGRK